MGAGSSTLSLCQTTKVVLYDDQVACFNTTELCEQLPPTRPEAGLSRGNVIRLPDNPCQELQLPPVVPSAPNEIINPVFVSTICLSHVRHHRKTCMAAPFVVRGPSRTYPQLVRRQPLRSHKRTSKDYIDLLYQEYPLAPVPTSGSHVVRFLPKVCLDRFPVATHPLYSSNPLQEGPVIARAVYRG